VLVAARLFEESVIAVFVAGMLLGKRLGTFFVALGVSPMDFVQLARARCPCHFGE